MLLSLECKNYLKNQEKQKTDLGFIIVVILSLLKYEKFLKNVVSKYVSGHSLQLKATDYSYAFFVNSTTNFYLKHSFKSAIS